MESKTDWDILMNRAESGDNEAQFEVALYFEEGLILEDEILAEQNLQKAFEWYKISADKGNTDAITRVADFLMDGIAGEKNIQLAIELYKSAINKGSDIAAHNLGILYRDNGALEKAFEYYLLAEKLQNLPCSFEVGMCYYYGIGTEENKIIAFEIFKVIAEESPEHWTEYEIEEANFILGQIYLQGLVVEKSIEKARTYLSRANADNDHRSALDILNIIGRTND